MSESIFSGSSKSVILIILKCKLPAFLLFVNLDGENDNFLEQDEQSFWWSGHYGLYAFNELHKLILAALIAFF